MAKIHNTARWKRLRLDVLCRDLWTCRMCGAALSQGKTAPNGATVDHVRPHDLCEAGQYDVDNLRSVCRSCHDGVCRSIEARHRPDVDAIAKAKAAYRHIGLDGYATGGGGIT